HGYQGMNIFASGYPKVSTGTCTNTVMDNLEETVTAGGSSLNYDSGADQYIYVWKTDKAWAGKAMRFTIVFADGTSQYARFSFTR
ncbi:MAG TPA: PxKF domain-containing protein, partial [Rubrobacter sp.]|nr:PxKF domain-containing protein [Rubrobacter sp.]